MDELTRLLRAAMVEKRHTFNDAAKDLGVSKTSLSKWLNEGVVPQTKNRAALAGYLGLTAMQINDLCTPVEVSDG